MGDANVRVVVVTGGAPGYFIRHFSVAAGLHALAKGGRAVYYDRVHKILGEGSFVLVISENTFGEEPIAYYHLYRIEHGKIAEHWDVLEAIPPRSECKNPNGKFGFGPAM